jgi:hypothetical protein
MMSENMRPLLDAMGAIPKKTPEVKQVFVASENSIAAK